MGVSLVQKLKMINLKRLFHRGMQKFKRPWTLDQTKKQNQNYPHQIHEALGRLSDIGQARGASNNEVSSTPHCGALWNECIMMKLVEMPSNNHPWYCKDSQKFT